MAKRKTKFDLFQEEYEQIKVEFPVIVKHKSENLEIFHSNGTRELLIVDERTGSTHYGRTKFTGSEKDYLFFVRRSIYFGIGVVNEEAWDEKIKRFDEINEKLLTLPIDETITGNFENEIEGYTHEELGQRILKKKQEPFVEEYVNTNTGEVIEVDGKNKIHIYEGDDPF